MTVVLNNPTQTENTGSSNFIIKMVIIMGFVGIFIYFGILAFQQMGPIRVNVPIPQIVIPNKINVDVQQTK